MDLALGVEYDGAAFSGFQLQPETPTVQGAIESALARIAAEPVRIACAGRTDAGVHATGQVIGFRAPVVRPLRAWVAGTNAHLPTGIRITWAREVDPGWHPRFSALSRRYFYLFAEAAGEYGGGSPLLSGQTVTVGQLDAEAMHRAARYLLGEQDFSSFRGAGCQSPTPWRHVQRSAVHRAGPFIVLDIAANAFLLHMVRNIAGALRQVGEGRRPESWIRDLLESRDRRLSAPTAPACGLYMVQVKYPGNLFPEPSLPPVLRALGRLDRF
jgi:tRNA pseudouridine38-40 synthase